MAGIMVMRRVVRYAWTHKFQLSGPTVHSYTVQGVYIICLAGGIYYLYLSYTVQGVYIICLVNIMQKLALLNLNQLHLNCAERFGEKIEFQKLSSRLSFSGRFTVLKIT